MYSAERMPDISAPPLPPPAKPKTWPILAVIGIVLVVLWAGFEIHAVIASGIFRGPDNLFGDQHLKTAVALIELNKVRYGKYPKSLDDLKFTGQWDQLALQSVRYYPNADGTAYFIEVERGWIGKPKLKLPDEFWQGTGYSPALKPGGE